MTEEELAQQLTIASDQYYNTSNTIMTDNQFDVLKERLRQINPNHPVLFQVGATPIGTVKKHKIPMGSQTKIKTQDELDRWTTIITQMNPQNMMPFIIQWKLDGISISINYEEGKLIEAITRGDGNQGEDITKNVLQMKNVKSILPNQFTGSLRGEMILQKQIFQEQYHGYKNPRNTVSGLSRKKDPDQGKQHIEIVYYDLITDNQYSTETEKLQFIKELGLPIVETIECKDKQEIQIQYQNLETKRESLPYELDGIIIRANSIETQERMGVTPDQCPKGQKCIKWESQKATTTLKSIIITMGHTGAIIPTGELEPIEVGGVTISHVLLNNYDYIEELGLTMRCQIEIERAGDVIPHISSVLTRTQNPITPLTNCFSCNTILIKKGVHYLCENPSCPERNYQKIKSFVTKRDIKFLGEEILRTIYQEGMIKEITDLYSLNKNDLVNLPCGKGIVGERRTNTILNEIEKSKKCPLNELFGCLGIPFLGRRQAEIMMSFGINTAEKFQNLTIEQLSSFEGFGTNGWVETSKAAAIIQGIKKEEELIQNLLKILRISTLDKKDHQFSNKSFCFTGIRMNKEQKKRFQEIGAIEKGSVSKNLDYLVVKSENSTSTKMTKATELNITILNWDEWLGLILP